MFTFLLHVYFFAVPQRGAIFILVQQGAIHLFTASNTTKKTLSDVFPCRGWCFGVSHVVCRGELLVDAVPAGDTRLQPRHRRVGAVTIRIPRPRFTPPSPAAMGEFKVHRVRFFDYMPSAIRAMAFNPRTERLAVAREDGALELFNFSDHYFQEKVGHHLFPDAEVICTRFA